MIANASAGAALRRPLAVAITGSKGGVGKSNLAINLAVALKRCGRRVLLVDGDLGLANVDVLLGLVPSRTVEHLLSGAARLEELLLTGPEGIRILPAASGVPELTRLASPARARLVEALARASEFSDDVLVDTGAGLGEATLSLQLAASRVVVVTTSEPTSLVDAYATLKVLWCADPEKPVDFVVNGVQDQEEAEGAYRQIAKAALHFLGREPGWLGPVFHDPRVAKAVRQQRALLDLYPTSRAARCYERIALALASRVDMAQGGDDYWQRLLHGAASELPQ
ncbi:MAG: MinD/ParA family protein [Acidobacteriia bacterium]|nr:MinD/ParA family protein [Terriglobia bacterium]